MLFFSGRELLELIVVIGGTGDGFFEDRRIRRHALEAVLVEDAAKFSGREQMAAYVIEPYGLSKVLQLLERIFSVGHVRSLLDENSVDEKFGRAY